MTSEDRISVFTDAYTEYIKVLAIFERYGDEALSKEQNDKYNFARGTMFLTQYGLYPDESIKCRCKCDEIIESCYAPVVGYKIPAPSVPFCCREDNEKYKDNN